MTQEWVMSDPHFEHAKIIEWTRREAKGFQDVDDMRWKLIKQWNSIVKPEDKVYCLGDFAFGKELGVIQRIAEQLNGNKHLILGNHDTDAKIRIYQNYFRLAGSIHSGSVVMTHIPVYQEEFNNRDVMFNIHGHNHNKCLPDSRYINVNYDMMPAGKMFLNLSELRRTRRVVYE